MPSKTSENIDPDNAKITSEQRPFTVIVEGNIGSGEILLQFTVICNAMLKYLSQEHLQTFLTAVGQYD